MRLRVETTSEIIITYIRSFKPEEFNDATMRMEQNIIIMWLSIIDYYHLISSDDFPIGQLPVGFL